MRMVGRGAEWVSEKESRDGKSTKRKEGRREISFFLCEGMLVYVLALTVTMPQLKEDRFRQKDHHKL